MNRETLLPRITDFLNRLGAQKSLKNEQRIECLQLWGELKNLKYYCESCSKVSDQAWEDLKLWHAQQQK